MDFLNNGAKLLGTVSSFANPITAPLSIAKTALSVVGIKSASPRIYGKLYGTIDELRAGVEGRTAHLNNQTLDDVSTVRLMDRERKIDKGMQGIWTDLLPGWSPTPSARALIRQLDGVAVTPVTVGNAMTMSPIGYENGSKTAKVVAGVTVPGDDPTAPAPSLWPIVAVVAIAALVIFGKH